ncbi:MAG: TetR family transcriptional regulator [Thermaerobacter sp.]|nr:TetR family transcriptional regulator [Thermaerobacter sp.]
MNEPDGGNRRSRRGRRPGESGTRNAILAASRKRFAEQGYDNASIRDIAVAAGVDPALVHHYYGSKESLFIAAMRLPNIPGLVGKALESDPEALAEGRLGELLARTVVMIWEDKTLQRTAIGLLRSALTHERAAAMLRDFVRSTIFGQIASTLRSPDAEYRVSLAASQVIGLLMARYVLRVEPLASASGQEVVRAIGPALQRYLAGDIGTDSGTA